MTKRAIVFGTQAHLVGVYQSPVTTKLSTGVVMLTAGMLPSSGPYRLHSRLANRLADRDIASLTFDLSGIGESLGVGSMGTSLDRASDETSVAISVLCDTAACERVILFGLCSGADDAIAVATRDDRVAGLILLDGFGYRTRRYYWHRLLDHYLYRAVRPATWKRRWRKFRNVAAHADTMPNGLDIREFPDRETLTVQLQALIDRDVRMHLIYTGGVAEYYNHADQVWQMLPDVRWTENASTRFFAEMDHTAMLCEDRERLLDDITMQANRFACELEAKAPDKSIGQENDAMSTIPRVGHPDALAGPCLIADQSSR